MTYDPFARGQHPVGVRSALLRDARRAERRVEVEVWYPALPHHQGQDLTHETQDRYAIFGIHQVRQAAVRDADPHHGSFPLLVFSHGMAGHRRQSTFLCTHLASHGYIVLAPDHGGSTLADLVTVAMRIGHGALPSDVEAMLFDHVADRPEDVSFLLDAVIGGTLALPATPELGHVGVCGHSFGGFTALAVAGRDARVQAAVALAPAGGEGPLANDALTKALTLAFGGRVATLYLALERDSLLPLAGIEGLFRGTPAPARMFVLPDADHMHVCDRAESSHEFFRRLSPVGVLGPLLQRVPPFAELVPESAGYAFANALTLAHADAVLKQDARAEAFLARATLAFAERGITVRQVS